MVYWVELFVSLLALPFIVYVVLLSIAEEVLVRPVNHRQWWFATPEVSSAVSRESMWIMTREVKENLQHERLRGKFCSEQASKICSCFNLIKAKLGNNEWRITRWPKRQSQ